MAKALKPCRIAGCNGNSNTYAKGSLGLCSKHYTRKRVHGDPLAGGTGKGEAKAFADTAARSDTDECILWPFHLHKGTGYGGLKICNTTIGVHRYVCALAHGSAPSKRHQAAHSCGVRSCVNPKHLRWASSLENHSDREAHGTLSNGERHYLTKLSDTDVREIRKNAGNLSQAKLGMIYGLSQTSVWAIASGKTWKHIDKTPNH